MKLNPDCIRAVMLEIEKSWVLGNDYQGNIRMRGLPINALYEALPDFNMHDIFYTLYNLDQAGFVDLSISKANDGVIFDCNINYMTFAGHEFWDRIRDTKNWGKIRKGMNAIRNYSLDAITAISEGLTNAAIAAAIKELGS